MALIQSETDVWIMLYYMALTFCVIILLAQIVGICYNTSRLKALHHESWVSKQGATMKILVSLFTTYSCSIIGISLVISRIGNQFYEPILCEYTYMLSFMAFVTAKLCNYYFFLQRAKLAQGLNKILPDKAFDRYFPILFVTVYITYISLIIAIPIRGTKTLSNSGLRYICFWEPPDFVHRIVFFLSVIFDLCMTAFFLYLYGKPMCDIVKHSTLRQSNGSPSTNEIKLRRCIMVNFVCSSISSVHTGIVALTWWNISFMSWWSQMDLVVNCICLFGMFASNRRLCLHCCCCCNDCVEKRKNHYVPDKVTNGHGSNGKTNFDFNHNGNNTPSNGKGGGVGIQANHKHVRSDTYDHEHEKDSTGDNTSGKIGNKLPIDLAPRSSNMPSLQTMSDFPQPAGVVNDEDPEIHEDHLKNTGNMLGDGIQEKLQHQMTSSVSNVNPIIPPTDVISAANESKRYKDIAERKDYISDENGINYLQYLDSEDNGSCWYYKSKLFWTWLAYYFCFCGNSSVCKCYICLCKWKVCKNRIKSRNHIMKFMFGAAKKVQYKRYYRRYHTETFNYILNHPNSNPTTPNNKSGTSKSFSPRQSMNFKDDDSTDANTTVNLDRGITNFSQASMDINEDHDNDNEIENGSVELEANIR